MSSHTPPVPSLDDELSVPSDATLVVPRRSQDFVEEENEGEGKDKDTWIAVAASLSLVTTAAADGGDVAVIPIDPSSSIRTKSKAGKEGDAGDGSAEPRSLIVGRQASAADVRIDHGSVSRRHAALFYRLVDEGEADGDDRNDRRSGGLNGGSGVDEESERRTAGRRRRRRYALFLKDCGGKHGTHVSGRRMEKRSTVELDHGDLVHFGNCVERTFRVSVVRSHADVKAGGDKGVTSSVPSTSNGKTKQKMPETGGSSVSASTTAKSAVAVSAAGGGDSRARREAEIAAMTASLDEAPTYTPYHPVAEDEAYKEAVDPGQVGDRGRAKERPSLEGGDDDNGAPTGLDEELRRLAVPASHEAELLGHEKIVSSIAVDPAGSRLVTGSTDMSLRLWDFGGMNSSHNSFRVLSDVDDGHPVVAIAYSNTGDRFLVGTTSAQPRVYDRDGHELVHFIKGDVYVTDMSRTNGHCAAVTGVAWHPLERDTVLTCSMDGSARIWDVSDGGKRIFKKLCCAKVYRAKNRRGQRTGVTAVAYHPGGREFALGTACGSLQIWSTMRVGSRPDRAVYDAHGSGGVSVNSVTYSADGSMVASRAADDDTVRVWDARRPNDGPIATFPDVPSLYESGNCAFSPNGKVLVAGTSVPPGKGDGMLKFFQIPNRGDGKDGASGDQTSSPILQFKVSPGASVVRVVWHPKLNQIFSGSSDGVTRVFYDPKLSTKGALLSTSRAARRQDALDLLLASRHQPSSSVAAGKIITPHALPMFRGPEHREVKRKREEERTDPVKTKRPEPPATGVLTGGRTSASVNFTQFVVKSRIKNKNIAGKDPREELFKYSEGKSYVDQAYEKDVKVLAEKTAEEEEEEMKDKDKK